MYIERYKTRKSVSSVYLLNITCLVAEPQFNQILRIFFTTIAYFTLTDKLNKLNIYIHIYIDFSSVLHFMY